jgi:hypothetical protein
MDSEMYKLIMEKRGRFEPGMLQENIMQEMFGSAGQAKTPGAAPQPFTPGQMMQRMLERSPMGRLADEPHSPGLQQQTAPTLSLEQTQGNKLTIYLNNQLSGYLKYTGQLKLSPDQWDKLNKLDSAHRKHLIAQEAKINVVELELEKSLSEDRIDLEAATQLTDKLSKLRHENLRKQLEFLKQSQQILTNEQRAKYQQLTQ